MTIQIDVITIVLFTTCIIAVLAYVNAQFKKADPLEKPKGAVLIASMLVEGIENMVAGSVSKPEVRTWLAPYVLTIGLYIAVSNLSGLFAFSPPTSNFSVTLTLALISFIMIQAIAIKYQSVKGYIQGYFDPHPAFFILNLFGKIAPVISMPLRLFGNILSGVVIMSLVYGFTEFLSSLIFPFLGDFNIVGIALAPVLHSYFDIFAGLVQMFIFITLTMVYIGNEIPTDID